MSEKLYRIDHDERTNRTMPWSVFGEGFGLRTFASKEDALTAATAYFGQAHFALKIWPDRTELRVTAAPNVDPRAVLDQAIAALRAEREALENCPKHESRQP